MQKSGHKSLLRTNNLSVYTTCNISKVGACTESFTKFKLGHTFQLRFHYFFTYDPQSTQKFKVNHNSSSSNQGLISRTVSLIAAAVEW